MATQSRGDDADIREGAAKLCARFPRERNRRLACLAKSGPALTEPSHLEILIPKAFDGARLPLSVAAAREAMRHGSDVQKPRYLPAIADWRLPFAQHGLPTPGRA